MDIPSLQGATASLRALDTNDAGERPLALFHPHWSQLFRETASRLVECPMEQLTSMCDEVACDQSKEI